MTNTTEHHPLWASPFFKQCSIEFWTFLTAGLTLLNIVCTLKTCQFGLFWPCVAAGSLNALSIVTKLVNSVAIGRSLLSFLTLVVYMFSLFFLVSLTLLIFINLFKEPAFDSIHFLYCFFCFQFVPSVCYTNFAFFFSSFLRRKIWDFSSFSACTFNSMKVFSKHCWATTCNFLLLCVHIVSKYFLISFETFSLTHWLFKGVLLFS